jgi:DegV family protein with EDD domain
VAAELGIGVVPLYLSLDGEVLRDDADPAEVYERLPRVRRASTSTPAPGDFGRAFEDAGADAVVCVTVASSVSAIHQAARLAAGDASVPVEVVDSGSASMGEGFVAMEAARAARDGASLDDVVARAGRVAADVRLVAMIETFEYLRRSGRVSRLVSGAGSALGIRPVFRLVRGAIESVARPRTRRQAMGRLAEEVRREAGGRPVHLAAVHAAAEADARSLLDRLRGELDVVEEHVAGFTPAMGVHTGPGLVGLAWFPDRG